MRIDRRRFLGFCAGATAGTALGVPGGGLVADMLRSADSALFPPKGPERFVLSVCGMCAGGCGIRARRIGERVVKLDGNPLHPINGGRLCPKGQAALQSLFHPDRFRGPMRRTGPRGSLSSFVPARWDEALDHVGARLRSLRQRRSPESLVLVRGSQGGVSHRLARRLLEAFGSPNDVVLDRGDEAASLAVYLTQGVRATPAYDVPSASYVLSLGSALLEASGSPVHVARGYGEFRQGRTGRRGKLVQVEPRLSATGTCADEWIAVRPGTEGIFGLGVAAVIVAEGLYDKDFVLEHTAGFESTERSPGLRRLLERDYGLEQVAAETLVPPHVILRVAREFAAAPQGLAVGPRRGPLLPGRVFDHLAAQVLNGLAGSIDAAGGALLPEDVPLAPWPEHRADELTRQGRNRPRLDGAGGGDWPLLASDPERLAEAMLGGSPYPADVVMVLGADPVFTAASPRFAAALDRVPLVVSFATMPDDTALHADWILPAAHFLESWDLRTTPPGVPYPVVSLAQPALAQPLHDVRDAGQIVLELARRAGPEVAAAFPWPDVSTLLRAEMDGLYAAHRGAILGTPFDEAWVRMMERAGWWAPGYRSADELWQKAQESGGWWDPFYDHEDWERVLRTGSRRHEFRADLLARRAPEPVARAGGGGGSLALILFEPLPVAGGTGAELPFLQAILDPGLEESWETWAEMNPETAKPLRVQDKDWVRITSSSGSIVARARVTTRVVPGTVAVPVGLGKRGGGRWAAGAGANPLRLLTTDRDPLCGLPDFGATTVQVSIVADAGAERPVQES